MYNYNQPVGMRFTVLLSVLYLGLVNTGAYGFTVINVDPDNPLCTTNATTDIVCHMRAMRDRVLAAPQTITAVVIAAGAYNGSDWCAIELNIPSLVNTFQILGGPAPQIVTIDCLGTLSGLFLNSPNSNVIAKVSGVTWVNTFSSINAAAGVKGFDPCDPGSALTIVIKDGEIEVSNVQVINSVNNCAFNSMGCFAGAMVLAQDTNGPAAQIKVTVNNALFKAHQGSRCLGIAHASNLHMENVTFENCHNVQVNPTIDRGAGGGLILHKVVNPANTYNMYFTGCSANHGGAMFLEDSSGLHTNTTFIGNLATGQDAIRTRGPPSTLMAGGALLTSNGFVEFNVAHFERNHADRGGAVHATNTGELRIQRGTFVNNSALVEGGVTASVGATMVFIESTFNRYHEPDLLAARSLTMYADEPTWSNLQANRDRIFSATAAASPVPNTRANRDWMACNHTTGLSGTVSCTQMRLPPDPLFAKVENFIIPRAWCSTIEGGSCVFTIALAYELDPGVTITATFGDDAGPGSLTISPSSVTWTQATDGQAYSITVVVNNNPFVSPTKYRKVRVGLTSSSPGDSSWSYPALFGNTDYLEMVIEDDENFQLQVTPGKSFVVPEGQTVNVGFSVPHGPDLPFAMWQFRVNAPATSSGLQLTTTVMKFNQSDSLVQAVRTVPFTGIQDSVITGDRQVGLVLDHLAGDGYDLPAAEFALTVTITDDDRKVIATPASLSFAGATSQTLAVTLGGDVQANTTVSVTCALAGCSVLPSSWVVTPTLFSPTLDYSKPRTVTVTVPSGSLFTSSISITTASSNAAAHGISVNVPMSSMPSITSISPAWVFTGSSAPVIVTISGSRLGLSSSDVTGVALGTIPCDSFTQVSTSQVLCTLNTVPATASAAAAVVVTLTSVGAFSDPAHTFEVKQIAPFVESISPTQAIMTQGTIVTLTGQNMGSSITDLTSISVAGFNCFPTLQWFSPTLLTCFVGPTTAPISGPATMTSGTFGAAIPSTVTFSLVAPYATVQSFTPTTAPFNPPSGTLITITGQHFQPISSIVDVEIAGSSCRSTLVVLSDTLMTCQIPSRPLGTLPGVVKVTSTGSQSSTSSTNFEYRNPRGSINVVVPSSIDRVSFASATGAPRIYVGGSDLGQQTADITGFTIGSTSCLSTARWENSTYVSCQAPDLPAGIYTVSVYVYGSNSSASSAGAMQVTYYQRAIGTAADGSPLTGFRPSLTKVEPASAPLNSTSPIVISGAFLGTDFFDVESIMVGDIPCGSVQYVSDTELRCKVPGKLQTSTGVVALNVTTRSGGPSLGSSLTFTWTGAPPLVQGITPKVVPSDGGVITIIGSGFGDGSDAIDAAIGEIPCSPAVYVSPTQIDCTIPPAAPGTSVNASGITVTVGLAKGQMQPSLALNTELNSITYGVPCSASCGLGGTCVRGVCQCARGYTGAPACDVPLISISGTDTTVQVQEGSKDYEVTIKLALEPSNPVRVILVPSASSQVEVFPSVGVVIDPKQWKKTHIVAVRARQDYTRDGNVTIALAVETQSFDSRYEALIIPPVVVDVQDSSPQVVAVQPEISPINGTIMNFTVAHLDSVFVVLLRLADNPPVRLSPILIRRKRIPVPAGGIVGTSPGLVSTNGTVSLLQSSPQTYTVSELSYAIPRGEEGTYGEVYIVNAGGGQKQQSRAFYVTDVCPKEGQWGAGADCRDCPVGAQCPGGYRMWAKPGFWTNQETAGFVEACDPPQRCLGTQQEIGVVECAPTYQGELCGECVSGYYMAVNNECIECPPSSETLPFIICDAVVWTVAALAALFVRDQIAYSYCILAIRMLQMVGGIGQMSDPSMPEIARETYEFMHLFSGDYAFLKPDCINPTPHLTRFAIGLAYNVAIFVPTFIALPVAWMIAKWHYTKKAGGVVDEATQAKIDFYPDRWFRSFIVWLAVVYFSMTSRSLEALSCQRIGPTYYMITDPSSVCYGNAVGSTILAVLVLCMVTVGFPVASILYLRKHHERMWNDERFKERWSMLYEFYKPGFTAFWAIEFVITCIIAASNSALKPHPKYQFSICLAVFALKFSFIVWKAPFYDWITNGLHLIMSIMYMIALNLSLIGRVLNFDIGGASMPLAVTLVALIAITVIGILSFAVYRIIALEANPDNVNFDSEAEWDEDEDDEAAFNAKYYGEGHELDQGVAGDKLGDGGAGDGDGDGSAPVTSILDSFSSWFAFGGGDAASTTPAQTGADDPSTTSDDHALHRSMSGGTLEMTDVTVSMPSQVQSSLGEGGEGMIGSANALDTLPVLTPDHDELAV